MSSHAAVPATGSAILSPSANALALLRLLVVLLPPSVLSALPLSRPLDLVHYILVELSVIALFRTLLGLPDPARALGLVSDGAPTPGAPAVVLNVTPPTAAASASSSHGGGEKSPAHPARLSSSPVDSAMAVEDEDGNLNAPALLESDIEDEDVDLGPEPAPAKPLHPLLSQVDSLIEKFLTMTKMDDAVADAAQWELVVDRGDAVKIWRSRENEHRYRLLGVFDAPLYTTFDFLQDIEQRPTWDEMTESARILEHLSPTTRIQHIQIKAIWPTAGRDLCMLSHWRQLSDTQIVACTRSIEHPDAPIKSNIVRMEADCAGQVCDRVMVNGVEKTRVLQVADGDPKGWVPKSLLTFVATKAMPNSFLKVNELVSKMPHVAKSKYVLDHKAHLTLAATHENKSESTVRRRARRVKVTSPSKLTASTFSSSSDKPSSEPTTPRASEHHSTSTATSTSNATINPTPPTSTSDASLMHSLSRHLPSWWPTKALRTIHRVVTLASPYAVSAMLAMMIVQRMRGGAGGGGYGLGWLARRAVGGVGGAP